MMTQSPSPTSQTALQSPHAGKCYQALIDSGAAISLSLILNLQTNQNCYKTPIQTAAKLNTADGSS